MKNETIRTLSKEEEELLYIDLCGRMPYGVKFCTTGSDFPFMLRGFDNYRHVNGEVRLEQVIPILRPMSSMTSEELKHYNELLRIDYRFVSTHRCNTIITWLNKNMFDYRELIPKGLAISTEEFNPYKDYEKSRS